MVEFYLLTSPRFPLRKKEHKSYFGKNRTHDFRTSRCAGYLLDHSGDDRNVKVVNSDVRSLRHVFSLKKGEDEKFNSELSPSKIRVRAQAGVVVYQVRTTERRRS